MRKYYVYILMDPNENIPKYVGISNNPDKRFESHLKDKSITKKTKWIKKLHALNQIPILKVIHESENIHEIIELEKKYIKEWNDLYKLTNTTAGGEYFAIGTPIKEYDLDGNYIDSYNSMIEYCELHHLPSGAVARISHVCTHARNFWKDRIFRYIHEDVSEEDVLTVKNSIQRNSQKHFFVVDLNKNVLGEFNSITEAINAGFGTRSGLSQCLSGKLATCQGNIICSDLELDYDKKYQMYLMGKSKSHLPTKINKYTLDGVYIDSYYSYADAKASCNLKSIISIKECIKGKYLQSGGYQWKCCDSTENIAPINVILKQPNKKINQYDLNGNFIRTWDCAKDASEALNIKRQNINAAARIQKFSGGYIWKYVSAVS